jgi:hypothetical protein
MAISKAAFFAFCTGDVILLAVVDTTKETASESKNELTYCSSPPPLLVVKMT